MKKILGYFTVGFLVCSGAQASSGLQFECRNAVYSATLSYSSNTYETEFTYRECNGGVGDDFTDCRDVVTRSEETQAFVDLKLPDQEVQMSLATSRDAGSHSVFTSLQAAEVNDQGRLLRIYIDAGSDGHPSLFMVWHEQGPDGAFIKRESLSCRPRS